MDTIVERDMAARQKRALEILGRDAQKVTPLTISPKKYKFTLRDRITGICYQITGIYTEGWGITYGIWKYDAENDYEYALAADWETIEHVLGGGTLEDVI